jgi:hypothetical protein
MLVSEHFLIESGGGVGLQARRVTTIKVDHSFDEAQLNQSVVYVD